MMKTVRANGVRAAASGSSGPVLSYTTGLTLWFKADSLVLNDGDAVTTWPDLSGNGYDASQSTAGEKPTYKTGILNGKPVVRFDGGDYLNRDMTQLPMYPHTIFIVFRESVTVTSAGVFVWKPAAGEDYARVDGFGADTVDNSYYLVFFGSTPSGYATFLGTSGASPWGIYVNVIGGGTGTAYLNGSAGTTDSSFTALDSVNGGGFLIGGRFFSGAISGTNRLNGDVAEILLYNTNLGSTDRQLVERYLGAKYGITVA